MTRALSVLFLAAVACSDGNGTGSRGPVDAGFIRFEAGVIDPGPPDGGAGPDLGGEDGGPGDGSDLGMVMDLGPPEDLGVPDLGTEPCLEAGLPVDSARTAADRQDLLNQVIHVVGTLERVETTCQPETCPDASPCCGACRADVSIDGDLPVTRSECFDVELGCQGTTCGQVCLPPVFGRPETFVGRLEQEPDGPQTVLRLFRIEP